MIKLSNLLHYVNLIKNFSLIIIVQIIALTMCIPSLIMAVSWNELIHKDAIYLYAGSIRTKPVLADKKFIGVSPSKNDAKHIRHDITKPFLLYDNSIDIFQAEDVFEHISYNKLLKTVNEIYRILKPGGFFRLSVPDYRCNVLIDRSIKDKEGNIVFDPGGGGKYVNGKVIEGGHLWFPKIESVKKLLNQSHFYKYGKINYLHFYKTNGQSITKRIDYSQCYVSRTPDHDDRVKKPYRAMSIVVDLYK